MYSYDYALYIINYKLNRWTITTYYRNWKVWKADMRR